MKAAHKVFLITVLFTAIILTSATVILAEAASIDGQYVIMLPSGGYGVYYAFYHDGSVYGTLLRGMNLPAIIFRIDLGTGLVVWEEALKLPDGIALTSIRSFTYVGENKILLTSDEGYIVVLDATDGSVTKAWRIEDLDNQDVVLAASYIDSYSSEVYLQIHPVMYFGNYSDRYEAVLNIDEDSPLKSLVKFPGEASGAIVFSRTVKGNYLVMTAAGKVYVGEFSNDITNVEKVVELTISGWNLTSAGGLGVIGNYVVIGIMNPLTTSYALVWLDKQTLSFKGAFLYTHEDTPVVLSLFRGKPFALVIDSVGGLRFRVGDTTAEDPDMFKEFVKSILKGETCLWKSSNTTRDPLFGFSYGYEGPLLLWFRPSAIGWYPSLALIDWNLLGKDPSSQVTLTYDNNTLILVQTCGINAPIQAVWMSDDGTITPLTETVGTSLTSLGIQAKAVNPETLSNDISKLVISNPNIRFTPVEIEAYSKDLELKVYGTLSTKNVLLPSKIIPEASYAGLAVGVVAVIMVSLYHKRKRGASERPKELSEDTTENNQVTRK